MHYFSLSLRSAREFASRCICLAAVISSAFLATSAPTLAQLDIVARDLYTERTRNEGNLISFCLRPFGPIAAFEAELAEQIGKMLLTEVRTYTLNPRSFPVRPSIFDYYFGLTDDQMFIMMAQNCDVVLGIHLSAASPEWLRLSRPYISANVLGITRDPALKSLEDLGPNIRLGVHGQASGDAALVSYFNTQAKGTTPERVSFRSNQDLFAALSSDQVDAALIWEGALMAGTDGNPEGYYPMARLPFPVDPIGVSAAVRIEDRFLGVLIDEALNALDENGTLVEMGLRHKVLWSEAR
ncbi:transporter substrate-binding domain-containing protein [Devosia sp. WQ 349]|uniref:substrate-binding periplasmic protein n=1 Tax=Devosia sp. WQ 349K1 TaxID=2800329 RepID=UPI001906BDBA|nr:transporter substrate-binding domain-containing protein [Devosia sp. WQ 349K1]MBK1796073.1 transporter substrate-binding domain-containing protein [Devosia sp. WQ 349K1]